VSVNRAGVELNKKGGIRVGPDQCSSRKHIFAAGDVCGPYEIVHLAVQQAELAARNAARYLGQLSGEPEELDLRLKLFVLFTEPQVALVGMSEHEARAAGRDCAAATYPFADHGKSIVMGETDGFVKLVTDRATGEIIGGAVVGPEGAELIQEVTVAMAFRATAAQLAAIPHYHPTLSEIWTYPAEELASGA
jgi:pyruvate/2-oxoglutarate dehydrogenase complex dihydrolipoamide dehydrogenase (E3) component